MAYRDSTINSGTSTTPSVAVPTGVQAGDIVVLFVSFDWGPADFTSLWPAGFTQLQQGDNTTDGQTHAVGYKRLTGSDSGSYTFDAVSESHEWMCIAVALSGRHASNNPEATVNPQETASNTPEATGVTAVQGDDLCWFVGFDGSGTTAYTPPTDYDEREDANTNSYCAVTLATRENVSGGATGTVQGGSSEWDPYTAFLVRVPVASGSQTHTDVAWGATGSPVAEDPIAWNASPGGWKRESDGGAVTVTGDASWGTLLIASGEPVVSDVIDTGDANSKTFTLDYNVYDTGGTPGVIQIRGSATTFAWDAGSPGPEWANYTAPTAQEWRHVQVRLAYS